MALGMSAEPVAQNPYGLPADVLASLQPVGRGDAPEIAAQRGSWTSGCQAECCQPRVYDGYWRECAEEAAYDQRREAERPIEQQRKAVFEAGMDALGITYGLGHKNLAAYAEYEKNFELAGRVA